MEKDISTGFALMPSRFAQEFLFFSDGMGRTFRKDFDLHRKSFKNNVFMHVAAGTLYVEQNGLHTLTAGDSVVMRHTQEHRYYSDPYDTADILWMHFGGRHAGELLDEIEKLGGLPCVVRSPRIAEYIEGSIRAARRPDAKSEALISQNIYAVLLEVLCLLQTRPENVDEKSRFLNRLREFATAHVFEKITLEQMAQYFHVSSYHLCRLCKKHLGESPMAFVAKMKIEQSKYLLSYTVQPICDVAAQLGFCDQSHFSKTFSRIAGVTPLAFRKMGL